MSKDSAFNALISGVGVGVIVGVADDCGEESRFCISGDVVKLRLHEASKRITTMEKIKVFFIM
jgi:hypothetical protein